MTEVKRWPWVSAVTGILAAIAVAVTVAWLLLEPNEMRDERAEIAAIQAVAAIGFGVGGIGTLILFVRRQWLQERIAADNRREADRQHERELAKAADDRHDASERRITELYMAAAEQLGHDKAPVRLAALHALDRLGQNEPNHRQVIADIWCSYLRQPFTPPARFTTAAEAETSQDFNVDWANLEYEVRATAQRLLASHLKDPREEDARTDEPPPIEPDGFWGLSRIDLTGATLINANFDGCWFSEPNFTNTRFYGSIRFNMAEFEGAAWFANARFHDYAEFSNAHFHEPAQFGDAQFDGIADFGETKFDGEAWFRGARFGHVAVFATRFGGRAEFDETRFHEAPWFGQAQFDDDVRFDDALLYPGEERSHTWPPGWALEPDPDGEPGWGRLVQEAPPSDTQAEPS